MHNLAFVIRKLTFTLLVFLSPASVFALENVKLGIGSGDLTILNPGVDQSKLFCLLSRCMQVYTAGFDGYLFTYNTSTHCMQFDNTTLCYARSGSTVSDGSCQLESVSIAPCIYISASNLDSVGDCYIWLYIVSRWRWLSNPYTVNSACFKVSGYGQNLTYDEIEALTITRITSPFDWIYPIYLNVTDQGNTNFSCYLTQNAPSDIIASSPFYNVQSQQAASVLQLSSHFSASWLISCVNNTGAGSVSNAWQTIKQRLDNNQVIYADSSFSVVAWGGAPATSGPAGYIDLPYTLFSPLTDFDRGGELDWSEYYRGNNMKLASDDNPNIGDIDLSGEIASLEPDKVPGQDNLDDMFSSEVTAPSINDFQGVFDRIESTTENQLANNPAYNQFKSMINPEGFNRSERLPRYQQAIQFTIMGQDWDLGNLDIDFNFLDQEPYKSIWARIRAMLVLSLFVMTFLACYSMYEKALAFSAG